MEGLLFFLLALFIPLFYLAGSILPTLTHIGLGYFLTRSYGFQNRWKTIFAILFVASIVPLFLRAVGLSQDLYFRWTASHADIFRTLTLKEGDTLFVDTNVTAFEYKPVYANAPSMGGNAGVGFRWGDVWLKVDYIAESLAGSFLTLDSRSDSTLRYPRIVIRVNPDRIDAEYYDVSLKILDQHGLSADYFQRIRRKHAAEPEDYYQRLSGKQGSWFTPFLFNYSLVNSYIWKPLASLAELDHQSPPISTFITKAIQVQPYTNFSSVSLSADLADEDETAAFIQSPWQLEFRDRGPNISCADTVPIMKGINPLAVYVNGTLRRLNMGQLQTSITKTEPQIAQLVVCGSMGASVISSKGLSSYRPVIHKYDANWRLISEEEISNVSLQTKYVSRYKDVGAYYLMLVAHKDGTRTAYRIPKKTTNESGFADKFSTGDGGKKIQTSAPLPTPEPSYECTEDTLRFRCSARRDRISDYLLGLAR